MTEEVVCARCHRTFEREREDTKENADIHITAQSYLQEAEPVCDDCEHQYLSWLGCPPLC